MHEYVKKLLIQEEIDFTEMTESANYGNQEEYDDCQDCLFEEALRLIIFEKSKSTAMLQVNLRIGFLRANQIIEQLEKAGVIKRNPDRGKGWLLKDCYATEEARRNFKLKK